MRNTEANTNDYTELPNHLLRSDPSGGELWWVYHFTSRLERDLNVLRSVLDNGQSAYVGLVQTLIDTNRELLNLHDAIRDFREGLRAGSGYHYLPQLPFTPAHIAWIEELARRRGFADIAEAIKDGKRTHYLGMDLPDSLSQWTRRDLEQIEQWLTYWIEDTKDVMNPQAAMDSRRSPSP